MKIGFGVKPSVLRCGRCGRFADWDDSRVQVVCGCRPHIDLPPVLVREASDADRRKALELFRRDFAPAQLVAYGTHVSLDDASALVAETENDIAGALAWRDFDGGLHVLALATDPMWQRAGIGGHLLAEAELMARGRNQSKVIVTLTNDNIPALYFFQRRGYRLCAVLKDAAVSAGAPDIIGFAGIPIRDELQLLKSV
jgi:ribosomal protein S18 acetylase RimI-like enzyme